MSLKDQVDLLQQGILLLFALFLVLGVMALDWGDDTLCPQHRKPRSQCKGEHRP